MLKTPGAPSKPSKRGTSIFKNLRASCGTAPNTPEDDDGVQVVAIEYDPSQDLEALAAGNVPSSPMRGDANSTNTPAALKETDEEEKKESENDQVGGAANRTSTTSGVDVVNKTLALFDDLCAVPRKPNGTGGRPLPHVAMVGCTGMGTADIPATPGKTKEKPFRHPEWGQEPSLDEDETVTNPSMQSESSEPYSSAYTSSTSMMLKDKSRGLIPKSPSQDHENFEVVLDPTSLQSDDEDDRTPSSKKYANTKNRRWPFVSSSNNHSKEKNPHHKKHGGNSHHHKNATSKRDVAAAVPPPIAEEELTEATPELSVQDKMADVPPSKNELEQVVEQQPQPSPFANKKAVIAEEAKITNVDRNMEVISAVSDAIPNPEQSDAKKSRNEPKKSIVKRSWKSCKKLITKAGGPTAVTAKSSNDHPAEIDTESAQVAHSVEKQQPEENLLADPTMSEQQQNEAVTEATKEGDAKEEGTLLDSTLPEDAQLVLSSTTDVWNSIVASIAGTFEPGASFSNDAAKEELGAEASEAEKPRSSSKDDMEETGVSIDSKEQSESPAKKPKSKPKRQASGGWKRIKSFKKSAKNLVLSPKKESSSNRTEGTSKAIGRPIEKRVIVPREKPKAKWKAVEDKDTGKTYYYHRETRETTWIKPKEHAKYEDDLRKWKAAKAFQKQSQGAKVGRGTKKSKSPKAEAAAATVEKKALVTEEAPKEETLAPSTPHPVDIAREKEVGDEAACAVTPPARPDSTIVLTLTDPTASFKTPESFGMVSNGESNPDREKRIEVERLLNRLPQDGSRPSLDKLLEEYSGKEDVLIKELHEKLETLPPDETRPFDEPLSMEARRRSLRSSAPRSPHRLNQRTTTFMSKASATTRSSALTDRTEKIKNTGKGKMSPFVPITEALSSATSISSRNEDDHYFGGRADSPARRIPSRVPVPRERQLMVEELTDSRVSAESYEGNGGKRGRIVRGRPRESVPSHQLDTVYDGDNDTEEDNTTAYDNDTYGTDSVSALSENDTDYLHRKDNFEQARRRALDDAIEREDWDLAAALSEGMRAANLPGGYERAHSSWNQSELDKFIANNDWSAVKNYIARMREKSQPSANKNIGARSQLQHKDFMSESSWTSDSQSSYESYDSESEV